MGQDNHSYLVQILAQITVDNQNFKQITAVVWAKMW